MQIQGEAFGRFACVLVVDQRSSRPDAHSLPPEYVTPGMSRLAAWYNAHRGPRMIVIGWLATRLLILVILAGFERFVVGDVFYYHRKINASSRLAWTAPSMSTHPGGLDPLAALRRFLGSRAGYLVAFVVFMLALDAVFLLRTLAR